MNNYIHLYYIMLIKLIFGNKIQNYIERKKKEKEKKKKKKIYIYKERKKDNKIKKGKEN